MVGTTLVALVNPDWLKLITYFTLLPLILLQAAGFRRPIQSERCAGYAFGGGLGVLYSMTTISGRRSRWPEQSGVREAGIPRRARRDSPCESSMTAVAYAYVGLYSTSSMALIPQIVPSLAIGVPIRRQADSSSQCRDIPSNLYELRCVGCRVRTGGIDSNVTARWRSAAYLVFFSVVAFDLWLLYRFFFVYRVHETGTYSRSTTAAMP
jgi:hypothetical protein